MQQKEKEKKLFSNLTILVGLVISFLIINVAFLVFAGSESKTALLLKKELVTLKQEERIIASAQEIYNTYNNEIDTISAVFPSEETIPSYIQSLEELIRGLADDYNFKFNSVSPLKEQEDRLFLPLTITMKTDLARLVDFLAKLENLPYMMQVTGIRAKTPEGFNGVGEIIIGIKLYVQNPFTTK